MSFPSEILQQYDIRKALTHFSSFVLHTESFLCELARSPQQQTSSSMQHNHSFFTSVTGRSQTSWAPKRNQRGRREPIYRESVSMTLCMVLAIGLLQNLTETNPVSIKPFHISDCLVGYEKFNSSACPEYVTSLELFNFLTFYL